MIYHRDTEDTEGSSCHITHDIVGGAIEVHRRLGPGLLESAYETCLCRELLLRGIRFQQQVPLPVEYRGLQLDCGYRLDIVVERSVIVEDLSQTDQPPPWPFDQFQCRGASKRALPDH
jgi:hypothetical protein